MIGINIGKTALRSGFLGRSALHSGFLGRSALVAAALCVATAPSPSFAETYTWAGASGADWATGTNWSPSGTPTSADTIRFENASALSVGGSGTLTVAKIVTTGAKVTFNCPVAFDGTYLVDNASNAPTFPGGATATKPDDSLTSMNAASHVLPDGLVFTEDWIVPTQASANPFVVPEGAHISGQKITGAEYKPTQPCIRIDSDAVATFTEVPNARRFVPYINGGRLVITGDILWEHPATGNALAGNDFCYYADTKGTVEANGFYKSALANSGEADVKITNLVVHAGGFGQRYAYNKIRFDKNLTVTTKDDTTFWAPDVGTRSDAFFDFNGKVFTVDTDGHTVAFDIKTSGSGTFNKVGDGELIMKDQEKNHTASTHVKGGKLTVGRVNGAGKGTTTVYSGAVLAFASAVTSQGYPIVVKNGGTLEWAAAVNDTSTLTLEAGAIVKPKAAAAFTATEVTLPSSGTVTVDLMDVPLTANTAVSILGGVSDASKFTALVPSGVTGSLSIDGTTLVYTPTAISDVSDADYVWAGANGADWAVASNWRVNGAAPATAPTAKDTIRFGSNATVGGTGTLTVYKVVATGSAAVTFNCPVQFRSTYKVVKGTGAVKFPGGATATHPDDDLIRTSSSSDLARTLDGDFTFTADWIVNGVGDKPWIVPNGATVLGRNFTGTQSGANRILRIEAGGYACFTTVTNGLGKGDIDINGMLEATKEIICYVQGGWKNFGREGNTGTIKAPRIAKIGASEVHSYIPNFVVGSGGFGYLKSNLGDGYYWVFYTDTTINATADFDFLGIYRSANKSDWGLHLNGKTVTVDVPDGITVTCGVGIYSSSGVIRKTGAGTLLMTDTYNGQSGFTKIYTGGTVVEEGTLRVAANNSIGSGAVTVGANGRLEVASGVTLGNIVKTSTTGAGELYMENGSSIALSADTPCHLASFKVAPGGTATITTSSSADAGAVLLSGVSADSASRLNIPSGFTLAEGVLHVPADIQDKFLEYIESTSAGKQWIDTGIVGKCDTRAEMTISWLPDGARVDGSFLSSRQKNGDFRFILCSNSKAGQYYCALRTIPGYSKYTVPTSNPPIDRIECSITATSATATSVKMTINGTESITSTNRGEPLDTGYTMYLFAQHNGAVSSSSNPNQVDLCSVVRCYGVKIWQDDVLVREYRPYMRNGKAGLYDAVSGEFFVSRSSTDFVAGPVLKPDHFIQYVESTGTQYIDTEVVGRPNTAMQAHVLWPTVSDTCFLGSRISDSGTTAQKNTRFVLYACNNTHYMAHRTYVKTQCSSGDSVLRRTTEPDFISSSISHDGTSVSYWMDVNGVRRVSQTRTEEALDTGLNMYLFAQNKGGAVALPSKVRCYDVKIWQDGVLVRDFRPCLKDGRAGLYDEVSSWIFFPQGGELNYPNETPDKSVRWANVSGSRHVPAGVFAESGVTAQIKVRPDGGAVQTLDMASGAPLGASADGLNLFMFATNTDGNPSSYFAGRFYSGKIWNPWGALVRDFKPCIKDNSIMFFDEVSQTMFRPYPAIPAVKGSYCPKGAIIIAK